MGIPWTCGESIGKNSNFLHILGGIVTFCTCIEIKNSAELEGNRWIIMCVPVTVYILTSWLFLVFIY